MNGHDDIIKWKHFPCHWPFVRGIHRWPVNSPRKGQWCGTLMFSFTCTWINGRVNNGEAGDLRRHRAHCDVIGVHDVWDVLYVSVWISMDARLLLFWYLTINFLENQCWNWSINHQWQLIAEMEIWFVFILTLLITINSITVCDMINWTFWSRSFEVIKYQSTIFDETLQLNDITQMFTHPSHYPDRKVHGANMGPYGADRAHVGTMLAPWTLLSG